MKKRRFQISRPVMFLISLYMLCLVLAVFVVTVKYHVRELHVALEKARDISAQQHIEHSQLILEKSTFIANMRVEKIARQHLQMKTPKKQEQRLIQQ